MSVPILIKEKEKYFFLLFLYVGGPDIFLYFNILCVCFYILAIMATKVSIKLYYFVPFLYGFLFWWVSF